MCSSVILYKHTERDKVKKRHWKIVVDYLNTESLHISTFALNIMGNVRTCLWSKLEPVLSAWLEQRATVKLLVTMCCSCNVMCYCHKDFAAGLFLSHIPTVQLLSEALMSENGTVYEVFYFDFRCMSFRVESAPVSTLAHKRSSLCTCHLH